MDDKELRKLKRTDLLELLLEQTKENEELKKEVESLREKLNERNIRMDNAGNIAEAVLQLSGIFEVAQTAAEHYLDNIALLSGRQEQICEKMEAETKAKCNLMEAETKVKCEQMEKEAEQKVEAKWSELSQKLEAFYEAHKGLRELLAKATEKE